MELLKAAGKNTNNPIPVIGIESRPESFSERDDDRLCRTTICAYYKAEARGFESGHEMEDWLAAEAEKVQ